MTEEVMPNTTAEAAPQQEVKAIPIEGLRIGNNKRGVIFEIAGRPFVKLSFKDKWSTSWFILKWFWRTF